MKDIIVFYVYEANQHLVQPSTVGLNTSTY